MYDHQCLSTEKITQLTQVSIPIPCGPDAIHCINFISLRNYKFNKYKACK